MSPGLCFSMAATVGLACLLLLVLMLFMCGALVDLVLKVLDGVWPLWLCVGGCGCVWAVVAAVVQRFSLSLGAALVVAAGLVLWNDSLVFMQWLAFGLHLGGFGAEVVLFCSPAAQVFF